jgi:hypothetical protein
VNLLAYKLLLSPALVAGATLAGRRWGGVAAGLVAGLPIVAGPILFFYALEQGPAYASAAAVATLMGLVSLSGFLLAYGWSAWFKARPLSSLLLGWVVFALLTILIDRVMQRETPTLFRALVYALAALNLGRRSLPSALFKSEPLQDGAPSPEPGRMDLPLRIGFAALLVVGLTGLAQRIGPVLGGLLAPFPVASTVLVVFADLQGGRAAALAVLKGLFLACNAFAVFCAVLAFGLTAWGLPLGFAAALLAAVLTQALIVQYSRKYVALRRNAHAPR